MRLIVVAAVHASRHDNANRRALRAHRSNLNRRRVSSQDVAGIQIERVMHRPCRMVFRNVQGSEVVKVVLHFRPAAHPESGGGENVDDPSLRTTHRVQPPDGLAAAWQGDIDPVGEFRFHFRRFQPFPAGCDQIDDGLLDAIDFPAGGGAFLDWKFAEPLEFGGDQALAPKVFDANRIQRSQVACRLYGSLRLFKQSGRAGHGECLEVVRFGQDASASLAAFAMAPNDSGSWTAISARTLRSTWISARLRPLTSRLYDRS